MTDAQVKAWWILVAAVKAASRAENTDQREAAAARIRRALRGTWKARGANDALSAPLARLLGLARGYLAMDAGLRIANRHALAEAAKVAKDTLKRRAIDASEPPPTRYRADLDG